MLFIETELKGAYIIELERREDERGFFARSFCQKEFEAHGLKPIIAQANIASNRKKGTLRGMHFQHPPSAETKLVLMLKRAESVTSSAVPLIPSAPGLTTLSRLVCSMPKRSSSRLSVRALMSSLSNRSTSSCLAAVAISDTMRS